VAVTVVAAVTSVPGPWGAVRQSFEGMAGIGDCSKRPIGTVVGDGFRLTRGHTLLFVKGHGIGICRPYCVQGHIRGSHGQGVTGIIEVRQPIAIGLGIPSRKLIPRLT
jgi:hypothetical protein